MRTNMRHLVNLKCLNSVSLHNKLKEWNVFGHAWKFERENRWVAVLPAETLFFSTIVAFNDMNVSFSVQFETGIFGDFNHKKKTGHGSKSPGSKRRENSNFPIIYLYICLHMYNAFTHTYIHFQCALLSMKVKKGVKNCTKLVSSTSTRLDLRPDFPQWTRCEQKVVVGIDFVCLWVMMPENLPIPNSHNAESRSSETNKISEWCRIC